MKAASKARLKAVRAMAIFRKYLVSILSVYLAFLVQTAVFPALHIGVLSPDLIMAALVIVVFRHGVVQGCAAAGVIGLMMDSLFTSGVGLYTLSYLLACALAWLISLRFNTKNVFFPVAVTVAGLMLKDLLNMILLYFNRMEMAITAGWTLRLIGRDLISAACAFLLFFLLDRLYEKPDTSIRGGNNAWR